jgi:putative DNA methylase
LPYSADMAQKRKLIEVALPLEVINRESAREKSIRHGHPSTLHLWWARRPLAAARAVLFAQLVDDPSSHPDQFPTEEARTAERERLHKLIERLVVWENIRDEKLLAEARAEIMKSTDGNPPPILDPFAGGGTIPLEAQRLGLEAHASDLNPVAVLINKALVEFPPKFRDRPPVFPGAAEQRLEWKGADGLAEDLRRYGAWMSDEAEKRIGHLYPKADGKTVIAWIWARAVTCPNPACGIQMPLVKSWWLGKKNGKEAYVVPQIIPDTGARGGRRVKFEIGHLLENGPKPDSDGTVARTAATCVACKGPVPLSYVRSEGQAGRLSAMLMAVVAQGNHQREYLPPSDEHSRAADVVPPNSAPAGSLPLHGLQPANPQTIRIYGFNEWSDLFTSRQLVALTTFSDLVIEAREKVLAEALDIGHPEGARLDAGGTEAAAYADAVAVYLGMGVSRMTDIANALCRWENTKEQVRNLFGRQAIPMLWDFAEAPPFGKAAGSFEVSLKNLIKAIPCAGPTPGVVEQADASTRNYDGALVSTDPPYYDNIGYSDLSDFFYVWQRRTLRDVMPSIFGTLLVPKAEELVANPHRQNGKAGAKKFFEDGFRDVFKRARETTAEEFPITVYYAFKQSESDENGESSSGWETLLEGMVRNGWQITATWPLRSELGNRMIASGANALASSIVLSLRPRPKTASVTDRPGFIAALKAELGYALATLQAGGIAPVDLPQAAIGPGMAVFSRYSAVREFDGSQMSVRSALARINEVLDEVLSEQEGDFDAATRFCIAWFRQHGYSEGKYGDAELLGNARGIAVDTLKRHGVLHSAAGKVRLFRSSDLPEDYDVLKDDATSDWEGLHHLIRVLEADGVDAAGAFLARAASRADGAVHPDMLPELAHLLFRISEDNRWTKEAITFNQLVTAWTDIHAASRAAASVQPAAVQEGFDFSAE